MREVTRDEKFPDGPKGLPRAEHQPSETELVIVSLLMRLYDLNLAILAEMNQSRADEVYEAHSDGGSFNPRIFIPTMNDED